MSDPQQQAALWSAIEKIAASHGLTPSGLAKQAGLHATAFNKSKRVKPNGPRWPSTETIADVLAVTGMTWAEFGRMVDEGVE
jgi:DNA-binding phage protein